MMSTLEKAGFEVVERELVLPSPEDRADAVKLALEQGLQGDPDLLWKLPVSEDYTFGLDDPVGHVEPAVVAARSIMYGLGSGGAIIEPHVVSHNWKGRRFRFRLTNLEAIVSATSLASVTPDAS